MNIFSYSEKKSLKCHSISVAQIKKAPPPSPHPFSVCLCLTSASLSFFCDCFNICLLCPLDPQFKHTLDHSNPQLKEIASYAQAVLELGG